MFDFRKSADIPMIDLSTGQVSFVLQVYGRSEAELQTIPNEVISDIAWRYPGYTSSPFLIEDRSR